MNLKTLRGGLFAVALGIAPFGAGCSSQMPLRSDIARAPAAWPGPRVPLAVGVLGNENVKGAKAPLIADLTHKSLVAILRASGVVESVKDLGALTPSMLASNSPATAGLDLVLACDIGDFTLHSNYWWWVLYALLFAIPFAGTASVIAAILLGGPVASDFGALDLRVRAIQPATGRVLATYHGRYYEEQYHTVYERASVAQSFISHPELIFQGACGQVVQDIGRDRFWLLRFKRGAGGR